MSDVPEPSGPSEHSDSSEPSRGDPTTSAEVPRGDAPRDGSGRRWFRFSLRTLLIVMGLLSVLLGLVGRRWYMSYMEQQALAAVQKAGGIVVKNKQGIVDRVYLSGEKLDDAMLAELAPHLAFVPALRELDLVKSPVTDAGLAELGELHRLRELYLFETKVTDEGIAQLQRKLPELVVKREMPDPVATQLAAREIFRHAVVAAAFTRNGRYLATGTGDGVLRIWDPAEPEPVATVAAHADWLFGLAFSRDGRLLATAGGDNLIKLFDITTPERPRLVATLAGHDDDVHAVGFGADDNTLISTSDDHTVRIWDIAAQRARFVLSGHEGTIPTLAVSPDGRLAATGSRDDTIRLWDTLTGELIDVLEGHTSDVQCVAFSSDGRWLASASYDQTVKLWDVATGEIVAEHLEHTDRVFAVAFSPDGSLLASGGGDGLLQIRSPLHAADDLAWPLFDIAYARFDQPMVSCLAFSPDGAALASGSAEGNIMLRSHPWSAHAELWTRYGDRGLPTDDTMAYDQARLPGSAYFELYTAQTEIDQP